MSTCTWITHGIGLCTSDVKVKSVEAIQELVALAPNFERKVKAYFADCGIENPQIEDYYAFDEYDRNGIAYFLQEVINEAEDIWVCACDDLAGRRYIIYEPSFPWELDERSKALTRKNVVDIITRFVSVISEDKFTIDDVSAENYG